MATMLDTTKISVATGTACCSTAIMALTSGFYRAAPGFAAELC